MNVLAKSYFRTASLNGYKSIKNIFGKRDLTRSLWHMCKTPEQIPQSTKIQLKLETPTLACSCGCGSRGVHTKGERELVEFLTEEISAEKKAQKIKTVPTEVDGFKVKLNGAEVELTKQNDNEKVVISFNVNHTVDADEDVEIEAPAEKPDFAEMKSKPQFEVDIVKGDTTLSFTCSFLQGVAQEGEYNDVFGIDEITIYKGEWNDKVYAVAGDVLDGYLYDLLMTMLEEKGVSNEFVEKLSEVSTAYEHSAYIGLLESLFKFTSGK